MTVLLSHTRTLLEEPGEARYLRDISVGTGSWRSRSFYADWLEENGRQDLAGEIMAHALLDGAELPLDHYQGGFWKGGIMTAIHWTFGTHLPKPAATIDPLRLAVGTLSVFYKTDTPNRPKDHDLPFEREDLPYLHSLFVQRNCTTSMLAPGNRTYSGMSVSLHEEHLNRWEKNVRLKWPHIVVNWC